MGGIRVASWTHLAFWAWNPFQQKMFLEKATFMFHVWTQSMNCLYLGALSDKQTLTPVSSSSFYSLLQAEEPWMPIFQHCHNEHKYNQKPQNKIQFPNNLNNWIIQWSILKFLELHMDCIQLWFSHVRMRWCIWKYRRYLQTNIFA